MSTELTVYSRMQDPLAFVREFGTEIALSKMFGCANEAQGKVLAMACMCEGENPIALSRKYHIIQNNLSMKADAMLAELRARGGKHRVIERTSDKAVVEITYDGQTYTESLSWEDVQQERYIYAKDGSLKDNWATPRGRRQMLWARVISEAVRTLAPEIVAGTYTPEETHDLVDEPARVAPVDAEQLIRSTAAKATAKPQEPEAEDAEFTPAATTDVQPGMSTPEQRTAIRTHFDTLGATEEQIAKALEKRGVKSLRNLTFDQAKEMCEALAKKAEAALEKMTKDPGDPQNTQSGRVDGPVGQVLVSEIKQLIGDDMELMKQLKQHLVANGCQKVADLSHEDALALKQALQTSTIAAFFERSLCPFEPSPDQDSG